MKKKLMFLASVVICTAVVTSGTIAYFTAEDTARNVITTNGVDITIEEWQETENGLVPYPKDEPIEIMPGTTVSKIAAVKNNEAESYIRAKVEIVISDAEGKKMELSSEALRRIVTLSMDANYWIAKEGDSEWLYYGSSVKTGEVTEPLFTEVAFDGPNMTNEYQNCTIEIIVDAQAVQTAHNGDSALEAAGWSAE